MRLTANPRTLAVLVHDVSATIGAWLGAYWLRFNLSLPDDYLEAALRTLVLVVPVQTALFAHFGLYRGIWRFASLPDLKRILKAIGLAAVAIPVLLVMFRVPWVVPRSVLLLDPVLLLLFMGGSRFGYRSWKDHRLLSLSGLNRDAVIVLGAGDAADSLLRDLARSREWRVVALLDDDPARHGSLLQGVKVEGSLDEVGRIATQLDARYAIIAMPGAGHRGRLRATRLCADAGLSVFTVPAIDDLVSGKVTVSQIRKVELDDLLGRNPVKLDEAGLSEMIGGRSVMVTGAGGSIGAELCRQIARFGPGRLILFELSEYALYLIEQELRRLCPDIPLHALVGDVKDPAHVAAVLSTQQPQVVFHAAAYKHVPLMENENAWEAVRNNVLGTLVLAEAVKAAGVGTFVLVSTDKAVNPTNVMGASKRLAEMVCQALQDGATRFVMVRFGNVLGSSGSVIPLFKEQIARGGPVTVTHPEITRYFMSIPEACQLVMQAGLMGRGGEIFVLDMGEPVKIVDLARTLIQLSGFSLDDIRIEFTGLRPGEKLYEEVLADDETSLPTAHEKLRVAKARPTTPAEVSGLREWLASPDPVGPQEVRRMLMRYAPEYRPSDHHHGPGASAR